MSHELHEITPQTRIDGELDGRYLTMLQVKELAQVPEATHILRINHYRRNRREVIKHVLWVNKATMCRELTSLPPNITVAAVRREDPNDAATS